MEEPIKLLIADDEESVRNSICKMVPWESAGISICGTAGNGRDAYEKIIKTKADIALLDIRMPLMTGLQVAENLKADGAAAKVIILSGYDDFNYAKEALVSGAVNYLLKPCKPAQILEAVVLAKEQILKERKRAREELALSRELEENRYDIKNKWISDLILTANESILLSFCEKFNFAITEKSFCLVVQPPENTLFFLNQQQKLIEFLESHISCIAGCVAENIVAVVSEKQHRDKKQFRSILVNLKNMVASRFNISVSIGIGDAVPSVDGLNSSYRNSLKALDMIYFLGTDFIIFYDSIYDGQARNYPSQVESLILEAVRRQNTMECGRRVDEFFHASLEENGGSGILKNAIALLLSLYHFTLVSGLEAGSIFERPMELMEYVQKSRSTEEVAEKIKKQCGLVISRLRENATDNRFVNAAILFIRQNYYRDITLSMAAEEIFISAGYLSTLFKQVTGDSFINYLSHVRIERACELLKDVRLKTYEVAHQVGFQDEKYFTRVFKKIKGQSPSQYRNE